MEIQFNQPLKLMNLSDFDFDLPSELIAQRPAPIAHQARLFNNLTQPARHQTIWDLPDILPKNSLIIINETKVIPAFLQAERHRGDNVAQLSINLLEQNQNNSENMHWLCFIKGVKKCEINEKLHIKPDFFAVLRQKNADGTAMIDFPYPEQEFWRKLLETGKMPLPPYIKTRNDVEDNARYQTIFAQNLGSVAAPTAGLHFTPELVQKFLENQCEFAKITLHVGAGTFKPIAVANIDDHIMHHELGIISAQTAQIINDAKRAGRFILVVGTTACRLLESAANSDGTINPFHARTNIFMKPGYEFKFTQHLLTNFHLPKSSLFILVSAFIGIDNAKSMMERAIAEKYRFFSFGDACLLKKN